MHLVETNGVIHTAADAELAMFCHLPVVRVVGNAAIRFRPLRRALAAMYTTVAKNRSRLARFVPDVSAIERLPNEPESL